MLVAPSFMDQTFVLFSFPDRPCVSQGINLAPLLKVVNNPMSPFLPARSPLQWSFSSTFQTGLLRITHKTGNLSTKASVFMPEPGAQPAAGENY